MAGKHLVGEICALDFAYTDIMKSYIVHIENKILFFYCEVEEQVQAVMIRWYGDKPYKIEACEFRSFYGYFSGFGAPANRHIILDGEIWRMGKYNSQRCIIRSGNKTRYLMNDGTIHIGTRQMILFYIRYCGDERQA